MPWLNGLRVRHEQQKDLDYLKKVPIISGMPVNNLFGGELGARGRLRGIWGWLWFSCVGGGGGAPRRGV